MYTALLFELEMLRLSQTDMYIQVDGALTDIRCLADSDLDAPATELDPDTSDYEKRAETWFFEIVVRLLHD